jgi:hypothetical protein
MRENQFMNYSKERGDRISVTPLYNEIELGLV